MAQLRRLHEMFPNELVIIGVHSAKFPSEHLTGSIRQAAMRLGIEHPVVNDSEFKIWNAYAVRAWPTLVLIDPRGRIAGETSGEILAEDFAQEIRGVIEQNAEIIDRAPLEARPDVAGEPERPLRYPAKVLVAGDALFIADSGHHRILQIRLDAGGRAGELVRVIGRGTEGLRDGPADEAAFNAPHGLGLAGSPESGTLYVADTENHAIRAVSLADSMVTTIAGTGQKAHGRRAIGAPTETALRSPWAVLPLNENQYLLIAMAGSHQVWVLIEGSQLGPFAGNGAEALVDGPAAEASFNQPSDLAFGMGYLFVADPEASAVRAIQLAEQAKTVTLVGQGLFEFGDVDGPTSSALLQHPTGLAFSEEKIYIADTYNNKIKMLDPVAGEVHTLIGSGQAGHQDGDFAQAQLFEPEGVQVQGNLLYIADTNNHLVRVADLAARRVYTLQVRGIERLPVNTGPAVSVEVLPPIRVAPGHVRLALDVRLPEGYKRNPEMPAVLRIGEQNAEQRFDFAADQEIAWSMDLKENQDLPVDLTLYYCQSGDGEEAGLLCLIYDRKMVMPVKVEAGAPSEARLPVKIGDR